MRTEAGRRAQAPPEPAPKRRRKRAKARRTTLLLRWCVVGVVVLVGFLYYRPLRSYLETKRELAARAAEVRDLRAERARLAARLERATSLVALTREARRLGYVRPGERLFIVKGVPAWRRAHPATIAGDG